MKGNIQARPFVGKYCFAYWAVLKDRCFFCGDFEDVDFAIGLIGASYNIKTEVMQGISTEPNQSFLKAGRLIRLIRLFAGFAENAVVVVAEQHPRGPMPRIIPSDLTTMSGDDIVKGMIKGGIFVHIKTVWCCQAFAVLVESLGNLPRAYFIRRTASCESHDQKR